LDSAFSRFSLLSVLYIWVTEFVTRETIEITELNSGLHALLYLSGRVVVTLPSS